MLLRLWFTLDAAVALRCLAQVASRLIVFICRGLARDGMVLTADRDSCLLISGLLSHIVLGLTMVPSLQVSRIGDRELLDDRELGVPLGSTLLLPTKE